MMQEEKHDNLQVADGSNEMATENHAQSNANEAIETIENLNAEVAEAQTTQDNIEIQQQDYNAMSMEDLVDVLESLVVSDNIMAVKNHVEEVKSAFLQHYNHFIFQKYKHIRR